jgi:anti-sigma factor ChrR (cupin superfamily)
MTRKTLEELAAGYAVGALGPADSMEFEALLAHDPRAREEVAAFLDTAAAMAAASSPSVPTTEELNARILAAVVGTPQVPRAAARVSGPPGFLCVPCSSSEGWSESGIPGFRMKPLSGGLNSGYRLILAELAAGSKIPEHEHTSVEELFILSGHLHTEGYVLGPGDFFRAEAGTHHHELTSPDGCTALLIYAPAALA